MENLIIVGIFAIVALVVCKTKRFLREKK